MWFLAFPAPLARRTSSDKVSWLQYLCSLSNAIICPCGNDPNFVQLYKGYLPDLQATQVSLALMTYNGFGNGFSQEELFGVFGQCHG